MLNNGLILMLGGHLLASSLWQCVIHGPKFRINSKNNSHNLKASNLQIRERKRKKMNSICLEKKTKKTKKLPKLLKRMQQNPRRLKSQHLSLSHLLFGRSSHGEKRQTSIHSARRSLLKLLWTAWCGKLNSRRSLLRLELTRL